MKKISFINCNKYKKKKKKKNPKIPSVIFGKCDSKDEEIFKEGRSIYMLKVLCSIKNIYLLSKWVKKHQ